MSSHLIRQSLFLRLIAVLEELLDNVIAKNVSHELNCVWMELPEDLVFLVAVGGLELLLNES